MRSITLIFIAVFLAFSTSVPAKSLEDLAGRAVSPDHAISGPAVAALRSEGQNGLDVLFRVYATEIENFKKTGTSTTQWANISRAIDSVAMQKDAYAAGLYWQTDLAAAKKASVQTGKPILSLRLLGNLNEEFSCANSRFFRSILYSDPEISEILRERYVLHWKSVRPAPRITIDFGDGRRIERTITGNSIHYVLDENGQILDALPGLYNPADFLSFLDLTADVHTAVKEFPNMLANYRKDRRWLLLDQWRTDLEKIGAEMPESTEPIRISETVDPENVPSALEAAPRAATKAMVEMPIVERLAIDETPLIEQTDFSDWRRLAELFGQPGISDSSIALIRRQTAGNSDLTEEAFNRMINRLESAVELDTVRNEYLFHTKIYSWLAENPQIDVENFNERVYAELFLTPRADEWLGLYTADVYAALDSNGVIR